ncbi:unnamed protein product, partial [Cyprideis torosa]
MTGLNGLLDGLILDRTPHIQLYNEIKPSKEQPLDLLDKTTKGWSVITSIKPKRKQSRIHNALPLMEILKESEDVMGLTAQVSTQTFYTAGSIELNGVINGINILEEAKLFNLGNYIVEGEILDLHQNDKAIILGAGIADKLSATIGDKVQLVSAKEGSSMTDKRATVIKADKINKVFRKPVDFHVLKDITFEVERGEFVSIMGKSGCGKSTLLYILSTMDTDYTGQLYLNEHLISNKDANQLAQIRNENIGFVFQFHYLLPEFSVIENVMLPARKLAKKSEEEIAHDAMEVLKMLDIHHIARNKSYRISGGEKQRVAIARALINEPSIIMGDEPTGNLDSKNSDNVLQIFKQLAKEKGLTLLVVTHDLDFAERTDRIITMEDGR